MTHLKELEGSQANANKEGEGAGKWGGWEFIF